MAEVGCVEAGERFALSPALADQRPEPPLLIPDWVVTGPGSLPEHSPGPAGKRPNRQRAGRGEPGGKRPDGQGAWKLRGRMADLRIDRGLDPPARYGKKRRGRERGWSFDSQVR